MVTFQWRLIIYKTVSLLFCITEVVTLQKNIISKCQNALENVSSDEIRVLNYLWSDLNRRSSRFEVRLTILRKKKFYLFSNHAGNERLSFFLEISIDCSSQSTKIIEETRKNEESPHLLSDLIVIKSHLYTVLLYLCNESSGKRDNLYIHLVQRLSLDKHQGYCHCRLLTFGSYETWFHAVFQYKSES